MIELQEIITDLNEIIQITENINSKYSIVKKDREVLRANTKRLEEIIRKLGELSNNFDNVQLQIIADEINHLKESREELDNKKELSRKNKLKTREDGLVEGYSDRETQKANYELLKELSIELDTINKSIQEKANLRNELAQKLETIEEREKIRTEIEKLGEQLPANVRISILKELYTRNLTPITTENLDIAASLKDIQHQNRMNWEYLKKEKENLESVLKTSLINQEEKKQIEQRIAEIQTQIGKCIEENRVYVRINNKIRELEALEKKLNSDDTKENIELQIKEYDEETRRKQEEKEIRKKEVLHKKEIRKKEAEIIKSMSTLPLELRMQLGIKLENMNLLTPLIDESLTNEQNLSLSEKSLNISDISNFKEELKELQENIDKKNSEFEDFSNRYNNLVILENTTGLSNEQSSYKEQVKIHLEKLSQEIKQHQKEKLEYQQIIRNYNQTSRLIDELVALSIPETKLEENTQSKSELEDLFNDLIRNTTPEDYSDSDIPELNDFWEEIGNNNEFDSQINSTELDQTKTPKLPKSLLNKEELNRKGTDFLNDIRSKFKTQPIRENPEPINNVTSENNFENLGKNNQWQTTPSVESDVSNILNSNFEDEDIDNANEQQSENNEEKKKNDKNNNSKEKNKVKNKRKSKKSIKKYIIAGIAVLATALVALGSKHKSSPLPLPVIDTNETDEFEKEPLLEVLEESGISLEGDKEKTTDTSQKARAYEDELYDAMPRVINNNIEENATNAPITTISNSLENNDLPTEFIDESYENTSTTLPTEYTDETYENNNIVADYINYGIPQLGTKVTIRSGAPVYEEAYKAYVDIDAKTPYFSPNEDRIITGLAFWSDETGLSTVYENTVNKDEVINDKIANGEKLVAELTTTLSDNEVEGWYSYEDVILEEEQTKGVSR